MNSGEDQGVIRRFGDRFALRPPASAAAAFVMAFCSFSNARTSI
jgi:hypothetical protein